MAPQRSTGTFIKKLHVEVPAHIGTHMRVLCVVAMYVAVVGVVSAVLRSVNDTVVSLFATAIIAVAFQPLRDRLQRLANRLVYGYRASPYEVMAAFSRRLGEAMSVDEVLPRIAEAAWRGLGAAQARVRLLGPDGA